MQLDMRPNTIKHTVSRNLWLVSWHIVSQCYHLSHPVDVFSNGDTVPSMSQVFSKTNYPTPKEQIPPIYGINPWTPAFFSPWGQQLGNPDNPRVHGGGQGGQGRWKRRMNGGSDSCHCVVWHRQRPIWVFCFVFHLGFFGRLLRLQGAVPCWTYTEVIFVHSLKEREQFQTAPPLETVSRSQETSQRRSERRRSVVHFFQSCSITVAGKKHMVVGWCRLKILSTKNGWFY